MHVRCRQALEVRQDLQHAARTQDVEVQALSDVCPFCSAEVGEELLLYGGSCPKCFGEIPGEEAATDPGAVVRAKQDRQDKRRSSFKLLIPLILMVPVIGSMAVLALGVVLYNRNPAFEPLELPDDDLFAYVIVEAPDEPPEAEIKKDVRLEEPTKVAPQPGGIASPAPVEKEEKSTGGLAGLSASFDRKSESTRGGLAVALCDPDQVNKHVRAQTSKFKRTLPACYQRARERKPELQGYWRVDFVISKTGYPGNIRWKGREMSDGPMEKCLTEKVKAWSYGPLCNTLPVGKNFKFMP